MRTYRVRMSCRDCTGQDPQGCFDGGTELLDEKFTTLRAAVDAGQESRGSAPYEFDVIDADGEEIETGEMTDEDIAKFDERIHVEHHHHG